MLNIKIDGDEFILTYPLLSDWTDMFASTVTQVPEWESNSWTFLNERTQPKKTVKMGKTHPGDLTSNPMVEKHVFNADDFGDMGWRPVLIPELPIHDLDGTLMHGGSFYCNNQVLRVPNNHTTYRLNVFRPNWGVEMPPLTIGDTVPGKELSWVVWHGALICTKVLLTHITGKELYELLPG